MTRLEQLGLEVAAENLMVGNRGLGRLLAMLLVASPSSVPKERLVSAVVQRKHNVPESLPAVYVRISLLRSRLQDLGFGRSIIETVYADRGYRIRRADADLIIERLKEAA